MRFGQLRETGRDCIEVLRNKSKCITGLQDVGRIHDVLGRRAPVAPLSQTVLSPSRKLLDKRQDRIPDDLGSFAQALPINAANLSSGGYGLGRLTGNDAELGLGSSQCCFHVKITRNDVFISEEIAHPFGAKHLTKKL
jgi:hypothetical protein